ncbi:Uncharacterised protein [Salmonella enterica subsp. arizonae]|uniref:Secreted protein n=1 Tax=Salmonella enterica subsp. arizonae TaxID=59203 RepID=A0A2X4T5N8_SALER|nr:Uncharacterised protein [Salmonella enterica subsp. arizonae]
MKMTYSLLMMILRSYGLALAKIISSCKTQCAISAADNGDIRRERTVAAAVMLPAQGIMLVRPGNPAANRTQYFPFSG